MGTKSAKRQFLVMVQGIEGFWATRTGGETSAETSKAWDGGSNAPDTLAGPQQTSNIVVSRTFDYVRDAAVLTQCRQQVGRMVRTISQTPTDRDMNALGDPTVWPDALLVALREIDVDAASGDPAMFELEWATSGAR